jgi:DNA repair protein RadC
LREGTADVRSLGTIYRSIEKKLRELVGESLDALLSLCAEADADYADAAQFGDDPPLRRMLARIGLIPQTRSQTNLYEVVRQIAAATRERLARVRRVLELYCAPAEGVGQVMCGDEPQCAECPLAADCRYCQRTPSITDLPTDQRPRERLLAEGEDALSDAELLAIILRSGTPEHTAVGVAQKLLARFENFRGLAGRSAGEMATVKGVGPAKAAQIKAALEIGRRLAVQQTGASERPIADSSDIFQAYGPRLRGMRKETFLAVLLDARHCVIRPVEVSVGSLTASVVHPREVFQEAVREGAAAVICVHNHPSGDPTPSARDRQITRQLHESSKVLGIRMLDHVVIGDGRYFSFADEGILPQEPRHDG